MLLRRLSTTTYWPKDSSGSWTALPSQVPGAFWLFTGVAELERSGLPTWPFWWSRQISTTPSGMHIHDLGHPYHPSLGLLSFSPTMVFAPDPVFLSPFAPFFGQFCNVCSPHLGVAQGRVWAWTKAEGVNEWAKDLGRMLLIIQDVPSV